MKDSQMELNRSGSNMSLIPLIIIIWVVTIISQLGSLAYSTSATEHGFISVALQSIVLLSLITLPLTIIGIWLGEKIKLGAPLLSEFLSKDPGAFNKLASQLKIAVPLGLLFGAFMVGLRIVTTPYLPPEIPAFGFRGVVGGLLVSFGAAVGEEVWFRLGILTIAVWALSKLLGNKNVTPAIAWTGIFVAAILFSAIHLPQLMSYGAASSFAVWGTIFGNTVVGSLYGWCYWRYGLTAAIASHFAADIVIHVIPAFFI